MVQDNDLKIEEFNTSGNVLMQALEDIGKRLDDLKNELDKMSEYIDHMDEEEEINKEDL